MYEAGASTSDNMPPVTETPVLEWAQNVATCSSVFRRKRPKSRFSIGQHETLRMEEPDGEGGYEACHSLEDGTFTKFLVLSQPSLSHL